VRLVALTGWGAAEDRRRSREAGFDEHLLKPAVPEQVRALVETINPAG
jgi:CheY-like chemotaxis protein